MTALSNGVSWDEMTDTQKDTFRSELRQQERDLMRKTLKEQRISAFEAAWTALVDPLYREPFNFSAIHPAANKVAIKAILEWKLNPRGLWIYGDSGRSKTRAVCALAKRLIWEEISVHIVDGPEFAHMSVEAAAKHEKNKQITKDLCNSDVLIIDDLGKRSTPSTWQMLYTVIEKRTAQKKPTIITTNLVKDVFQRMVSDDQLYGPLKRRMLEFFEILEA